MEIEWFETRQGHSVVSLSKTLYPFFVLVQPRKTENYSDMIENC